MYRMPAVAQDVGGVLDSGFALFKAGWRQVFALAALAGAATSAWRLVDDTVARMLEGDFTPQPLGWHTLLLLLGALVGIFLNLGVIARFAALAAGRAISVRTALWRALRRYLSFLLCILALGVALLGPLIAVAFALAGAGVLASGGALLFGVLFGLLAVGLASLLLVYWYFAMFLVITRNVGFLAALHGSFVLVRGHWWRTVAILVVAYAITLVATVLVGAVAAALGALVGLANINADGLVFLMEALGAGITMPFMIAVSLLALNDLEVRRRGSDLAVRIDAAAK